MSLIKLVASFTILLFGLARAEEPTIDMNRYHQILGELQSYQQPLLALGGEYERSKTPQEQQIILDKILEMLRKIAILQAEVTAMSTQIRLQAQASSGTPK